MRWGRRLIVGAVTAVVAVSAGVWLEHSRPLELPRPSGPLPVGRTSRTLGGDIVAWIWYPAVHSERVAPYLPDAIVARWTRQRPAIINLLTRDLTRVRAHGVSEAPFARDVTPSPVLLFRGGGGGGVLSFTALFEELASHGYVVLALEGGLSRNPETCVGQADEDSCADALLRDAVAVMGTSLERLVAISSSDPVLGGQIDMSTLGVFGYSFGGTQAVAFCAIDSRCAAGVNIDGRLFERLAQATVTVPFLWLLSDHGADRDAVSERIVNQIQAVYSRQPAESRLRVAIRGAHHATFSEDGALLKSSVFRGVMRAMGVLKIDGRRQVAVSSYAVRRYFDRWLKRSHDAGDVLASPAYPEIVVMR